MWLHPSLFPKVSVPSLTIVIVQFSFSIVVQQITTSSGVQKTPVYELCRAKGRVWLVSLLGVSWALKLIALSYLVTLEKSPLRSS